MTPEEKETAKNERRMNSVKFVIVEKRQFEDFKKLKKLKESTHSLILSDNLGNSSWGQLIKKVNSANKLLG